MRTSHVIAPADHPFAFACEMHSPSVLGSMNPLSASDCLHGLPMTSLFRLTPDCAISKMDVFGKSLVDVVSKLLQVLYASFPSVADFKVISTGGRSRNKGGTHGCKTITIPHCQVRKLYSTRLGQYEPECCTVNGK